MDLATMRIPSWREKRIERGHYIWRNMSWEQKEGLINGLIEKGIRVTPENCLIEASAKKLSNESDSKRF